MGIPDFAPRLDSDLVRPFYGGLEKGELRLPACPRCGTWYWYPPEVVACHPEERAEWRSISPVGTVYTFTTIERSLLPGDRGDATPYTVLMVESDDAPGARVLGLLVNAQGREPECGMRVRLSPVRAPAGHVLPAFAPID